MPIPFLLAGLGIGAAVIGAGGHLSAKETNEKAQSISEEAQSLYNNAKCSLENAQKTTEKSLLELGYLKKKVLETSIDRFLKSYERIKNIELSESIGLDEIRNFALEKQDALQLREMSDIYQSTFSSGAAGAATGAVIALAASGSLPIVTGVLSTAGTALAAGEVGIAAGLAGSALSFGAAMTPLAAIAAPVVLFTGISASIKADENLEKANAMYAEAEVAAEKMKTSEVLCTAIAERADMFGKLLSNLNNMFSQCTVLLDGVTRTKMSSSSNTTVDARNLSEDELKLLAVTRALAGAVKAVIDTPILTSEGTVSSDSKKIYDDTAKKLPAFVDAVNDVKNRDYNIKPANTKSQVDEEPTDSEASTSLLESVRNVLAVILGGFASKYILGMVIESYVLGKLEKFSIGLVVFAITILIIMNNDTKSKIFGTIKNLCCISIAAVFGIFFYNKSVDILHMKHYIICTIIIGVVSGIMHEVCFSAKSKLSNNMTKTLARIFGCICVYTISILLFSFLYKLINLSLKASMIIVMIFYSFLALGIVSRDTDTEDI